MWPAAVGGAAYALLYILSPAVKSIRIPIFISAWSSTYLLPWIDPVAGPRRVVAQPVNHSVNRPVAHAYEPTAADTEQLVIMGFEESLANAALKGSHGNMEQAVQALLST